MTTLGQRLKQSRESWGWTQQELSKESGINSMAISHFECGQRSPNIRNAIRLCNALGLTMDWLTRGTTKPLIAKRSKAR